MKKCFKCGAEKELYEFYKHPQMLDGHLGKCKECAKKDVRRNYQKNIEHYTEYEKGRAKTPVRRRLSDARCKADRKKHPERYKARTTLGNALRDGLISKKPCFKCGSERHVHGHHKDYSKPLEVTWLCAKCHHEWHLERRMA